MFETSSRLLAKAARLSKSEFLLQFQGFQEASQDASEADRVVGEILTGITSESDP